MLPILLGLILAMLFGMMSFFVYGLEGLINYPWIDTVFWVLILTGTAITLINEVGQCLACKLKKRLAIEWFEQYCSELVCAK